MRKKPIIEYKEEIRISLFVLGYVEIDKVLGKENQLNFIYLKRKLINYLITCMLQ